MVRVCQKEKNQNKTFAILVQPQQPVITKASDLVESSTSVPLANCSTMGFRPATGFSLVWTFGSKQQTYTGTPSEDLATETYSATSQYETAVNRSDNGRTLTCSVTHGTLSSPKTTSTLVVVQCKNFI